MQIRAHRGWLAAGRKVNWRAHPARALEGDAPRFAAFEVGGLDVRALPPRTSVRCAGMVRDGSALRSFCLTRDSQVFASRRLWSVCAGLVQARCELLQAQQELAISFRQRQILQMHGAVSPELQQLIRAQVVLREQGEVCRSQLSLVRRAAAVQVPKALDLLCRPSQCLCVRF